jgi:hypothetical protein
LVAAALLSFPQPAAIGVPIRRLLVLFRFGDSRRILRVPFGICAASLVLGILLRTF